MRGDFRERAQHWLFQDRIPLIKLLIVTNIVTFFAINLFRAYAIQLNMACLTRTLASSPWTPLTYPLVAGCDALCMLFSLFWLWMAGGSLERGWGTAVFARFFFVMSAVSALGVVAGGWLAGQNTGAVGMLLPLAGVTMAFAMLNPEEQILIFFIIPMKLKYLALLDVAFVLVGYGREHILIGVCALAGCAFAYWYVRTARYLGSSGRRDTGRVTRVFPRASVLRRLNPFRRMKDRRDQDRLRKLFEDSGMGDDESPR